MRKEDSEQISQQKERLEKLSNNVMKMKITKKGQSILNHTDLMRDDGSLKPFTWQRIWLREHPWSVAIITGAIVGFLIGFFLL